MLFETLTTESPSLQTSLESNTPMNGVFDNIHDLLQEISGVSKTSEKERLLKTVSTWTKEQQGTFHAMAKMVWDNSITYGISGIPKALPSASSGLGTGMSMFDVLNTLISGTLSKKKDINQMLSNYLSDKSKKEERVLSLVLKRDLRCGVSVKTYNKVFRGEHNVYDHPYMRCDLFTKKTRKAITLPAYSQLKADGQYTDIIIDKEINCVVYMSRQGLKKNFNCAVRDNALLSSTDSSVVISAEALVLDDNGVVMERTTGNGLLNSSEVDVSKITFMAWDCIPLDDFKEHSCIFTYETRFNSLKVLLSRYNVITGGVGMGIVETIFVHTWEEVREHFVNTVKRGMEGTVLKDRSGLWSYTTSNKQLKLKIAAEADMVVTGWNEGEGKWTGMLGSLIVESSDGAVKCSISGFPDDLRKDLTKRIQNMIDNETVVSVLFNGIVSSKSRKDDTLSLFLPRFCEERTDKSGRVNADDLERINSILESAAYSLVVD